MPLAVSRSHSGSPIGCGCLFQQQEGLHCRIGAAAAR
jgi:hypothetical protein